MRVFVAFWCWLGMLFSMFNILDKFLGTPSERYVKKLQPTVAQINVLADDFSGLSDAELAAKTDDFKARYVEGESLESLLPEAFAAVREAAKRALGLWAFDVQLIGGMNLHAGRISEMKTGEGKTLVATFPSYLNALTGKGVHVVTVNDYLAERDGEWMRPVFEALGMTCASLTSGLTKDNRRALYQSDVLYATNNELGFDYLRDNMAHIPEQLAQRPLHFAIVDEVDSILVDEARTPLIISGPAEDTTDLYGAINTMMPHFVEGDDYEKDVKMKTVTLTDVGTDKAEEKLRASGLLSEGASLYDVAHVRLVHHVNNALKAHTMFALDVDYIIHEGEVVLIDEFTGRMTQGRRLSDGLHQAIEAKEGVDVKQENQTLASVTYQNYFRLYEKLAGMTGTAETEAEEFETIYNLPVTVIPTNVPVARVDENDYIYLNRAAKFKAIVADVAECYGRGQPVLVGTTSIEKSEELAAALTAAKIPHNVLNARFHEQEAEIVAQAGRLKAVTIATNMAGRGTDIKLGGNLELLLEAAPKAKHAEVEAAQVAEKAEVMALGGLRIIGTERHESRRIDNQLRGRAGRQGDAGSSIFYLSMEDDLMRVFAKNLDGLMKKLSMPEDEAIQHPWVSKSIETAQRKIESMHFDVRKQILKYDDVLNEQRKVLYDQRRDILTSDDVLEIAESFRETVLDTALDLAMVTSHQGEVNLEGLREEVLAKFDVQPKIEQWWADLNDAEEFSDKLHDYVADVWAAKVERITPEIANQMVRLILLQIMDHQWRGHLQQLDYLRKGIGLRGYAQKDPINEYTRESFTLFENLLDRVKSEGTAILSRAEVGAEEPAAAPSDAQDALDAAAAELSVQADISPDTPRNAPCPCGSGKKFKHCHGVLDKGRAA